MGQFSSIKVNIKSAIVFILCFTILILLPSLFAFLSNEFIWFGLLFTILFYLLLGIGLLYFANTDYFKGIGILDSILGKIGVYLITVVLSCWLYYLVFNWIAICSYTHIIMLNIFWVFIPYMFTELKKTFLQIPDPFYDYWNVGTEGKNNEYWDKIDKFHLMQVSIQIRKRVDSEFLSNFDVKIAQEVNLGSWFDKFIEDQNYRFPNDAIETNQDNKNMGWIFYTPKYFKFPLFIRTLDPRMPIIESKIKNKQIIFAKRVMLNQEADKAS
jgi:hypothetical protein